MATGWIIGAGVIVMLAWLPPHVGIAMGIVVGLAEGFLGAAVATIALGRFAEAAGARGSSRSWCSCLR